MNCGDDLIGQRDLCIQIAAVISEVVQAALDHLGHILCQHLGRFGSINGRSLAELFRTGKLRIYFFIDYLLVKPIMQHVFHPIIIDIQRYPDILCQGQLCETAHISKRRARYLLDKGLIPNVHSPNRRLGYKIKKEDVRVFLRELKENPELYALPASARPRKPASPKLLEAYYLAQLESYPDILDAKQVIELTGYGTTSVHRWLSSGKLKSFLCGNKRRIPKKFLLTFLLSKTYSIIPHKSKKHETALRRCRGKEAAE